jgi:NAD(P)-dependent dehydrogenase (short-subunit alcohol dehydrogenase family)
MSLPDLRALYDLSGKVALVTGGGEGIGGEIVRHLVAAGATVVIADRNVATADALAEELRALGGAALSRPLDVAEEASVVALFAAVAAEFGRLDILVNNAGIQDRAHLLDTSAELWDRIQSVNARGTFLCVREAARAMRAAGHGGRIVNISSIGSVHPVMPGLAAYNGSKAAVNALTRSAALELGVDGIVVNAIFPGGVMTDGALRAVGPQPSGRALGDPLTGRRVDRADIAAMALFLCGPQAAVITGQTFTVDAGFMIQ